MRILIAVNAHSRRGRMPLNRAVDVLLRAGHSVEVRRGARSKDVGRIIDHWAASVDAIVLGGGDGTVNAAAPALLRAGLPVGLLPLGTANDLAATLGIPDDLEAAAKVIAEGQTRRIDIGEVNGHPFLNVASLGLSVALTRSLSTKKKRRWGRLAYTLAGLKALWKLRSFEAQIVGDETAHDVRAVQIAVGNGRFYGGGAVVEDDAQITDHLLHLYSIETDSLLRLARMYRDFRKGQHGGCPEVRTLRGPWFEIRTGQPLPVEADGKVLTQTPARFVVRPRALSMFAQHREGT